MNDEDTQFEYWKVSGYFRILDCVLSGLRSRFSTESLKIGHSIDNFMKLKYDESLHFIEHYEVRKYMKIYYINVNIRFLFLECFMY